MGGGGEGGHTIGICGGVGVDGRACAVTLFWRSADGALLTVVEGSGSGGCCCCECLSKRRVSAVNIEIEEEWTYRVWVTGSPWTGSMVMTSTTVWPALAGNGDQFSH